MGIYGDYLDRQLGFPELTAERKKQLERISMLRGGRDVLVFAADLNKGNAPISIGYSDLLPIDDQLSNLSGKAIDVILETPGGAGEIAEDVVRLLHGKYEDVGVIIPGCAKSAGTIMAMAADEILMEPVSSLGPIDAQLFWQGKVFSADALIEGMEKIKQEVEKTGVLNKAYIPVLQGISPGELQSAENALEFAKVLVTDWLARYKFKNWTQHASTGKPVSEKEKKSRANEIATALCNHRRWKTHGRSIKLSDLEEMRLKITDYSKMPDLADAIRRYYTLLQMTFSTNIYKVFETPKSQIYRFMSPQVAPPQGPYPAEAEVAILEIPCGKCGTKSKVQANLNRNQPLQAGCLPFPADNRFPCPTCGAVTDLSDARRQIEAQSKKPVVS
jgi:Serine dehydrogenase proteinase